VNSVLLLQNLTLVAPLPFGFLAFAIARRGGERGARQVGWLLSGFCFVLLGVVGVLHGTFAYAAFQGGAGSQVWERFLVWSPAGNYSRPLAVIVFAGSLLVIALRQRLAKRVVGPAMFAMTLALGAGVVLGLLEGPLRQGVHLPRLAVISALLIILLLGGLLAAAATDAIDQFLWLAIAVYTLKNVLSVSMLTLFAWLEHARQLPPETLYAMHSVAWLAMILLALRRYQLATRGRFVPAIFERSPVRRRVMV
jgi:hypothetical protein